MRGEEKKPAFSSHFRLPSLLLVLDSTRSAALLDHLDLMKPAHKPTSQTDPRSSRLPPRKHPKLYIIPPTLILTNQSTNLGLEKHGGTSWLPRRTPQITFRHLTERIRRSFTFDAESTGQGTQRFKAKAKRVRKR